MSSAETETAGIDLQVQADLDAVMKRIIDAPRSILKHPAGSRSVPTASRRKSAAPEALWTMPGSRRCFTTMTTHEVRPRVSVAICWVIPRPHERGFHDVLDQVESADAERPGQHGDEPAELVAKKMLHQRARFAHVSVSLTDSLFRGQYGYEYRRNRTRGH